MTEINLSSVMNLVGAFVARTKGPITIKADTALMREGHLDSFGLVELIAELERALGLKLGDGTLIPDDFETPQVLFDRLREVAS